MMKDEAAQRPLDPARVQLDAQDLIEALSTQRNDALNAALLAQAGQRSLARRISELEAECERLKDEQAAGERI